MAELSSHDWGELSVADRDQMHRLLVLREQILLKEAKARQLGLDLPLHEERGLSLENDQQGEITMARLSGYLDILTQALEKAGPKPVKISADRVKDSREQAERWLYELLFRAEQFFPEALKAIKPGMIAETAPFPLEELVKQLHGDQKLLP
ncbi:hypothetical protein HY546_00370, partial [archaeon]|nr:hypothetical protein [archaeon]